MERVDAIVALGRALRAADYRFVTVTPETHRRNLARDRRRARSLVDVFGWSRAFDRDALPAPMIDLLAAAGALVEASDDGALKSAIRFSTLNGDLFAHSAYPTTSPDAVFFGPDTYRFARAIARLGDRRFARVVDVGAGSGAGGLAARAFADRITLADVNDEALVFARANAILAGQGEVEIVKSDVLGSIDGRFDLVVANPPYMRDALGRAYRDGGGDYGEELAIRIARESIARIDRGGALLLYTGAPVVDGRDVFFDRVRPVIADRGFTYEEIDPDVFGEELDQPGYERVERIAAVALVVTI